YTNQGNAPKAACQSVRGTTIRNGRRPTVSTLITTAGRSLRISAPTEGSKRTTQISPLWCRRAFPMKVFLLKGLEIRKLWIGSVHLFCQGRSLFQDGIALGRRKSPQLRRRP